ncbi:MAG: VWA domain-containing protein, partial [Acidobacteria bacterium]|nr:VWA domain-containing protein [Acidobacteriota bacterium]
MKRCIAVLLGVTLVMAQDPAPPGPVIKVTVSLVQIDAVVTGAKGNHVSDLNANDFEILQDGRRQTITHFTYVPGSAPGGAAPADRRPSAVPQAPLRREDARRAIALVVDDLTLSFESVLQVREALRKFVDEQMQAGDLVAIVRTSAGMGALQQFTSDKRRLHAAIENLRLNMTLRLRLNSIPPLSGQLFPADIETERIRNESFSVGTLGAVSFVVRALRQLPGRKAVLLLSDGFRTWTPEEGIHSRITDAMRRLADLANRSAVLLYSLDPRGLADTGLTAADDTATAGSVRAALKRRRDDHLDSRTPLAYLAAETGGLFLRDTNDLPGAVRRVLDDQ